jgi:hypothetical protein
VEKSLFRSHAKMNSESSASCFKVLNWENFLMKFHFFLFAFSAFFPPSSVCRRPRRREWERIVLRVVRREGIRLNIYVERDCAGRGKMLSEDEDGNNF